MLPFHFSQRNRNGSDRIRHLDSFLPPHTTTTNRSPPNDQAIDRCHPGIFSSWPYSLICRRPARDTSTVSSHARNRLPSWLRQLTPVRSGSNLEIYHHISMDSNSTALLLLILLNHLLASHCTTKNAIAANTRERNTRTRLQGV